MAWISCLDWLPFLMYLIVRMQIQNPASETLVVPSILKKKRYTSIHILERGSCSVPGCSCGWGCIFWVKEKVASLNKNSPFFIYLEISGHLGQVLAIKSFTCVDVTGSPGLMGRGGNQFSMWWESFINLLWFLVSPGWQPRWFVLDNGILSYYDSQDDVCKGSKGSIKMAVCEIKGKEAEGSTACSRWGE